MLVSCLAGVVGKPLWRTCRIGVATVLGAAALSPLTVHAFTLIGFPTVTVTPTSGYPTAALKADGKFPGPACGTPMTFNFYWDTNLNLVWSKTMSVCTAGNYDTGLSPGFAPVAGFNDVGPHQVILIASSGGGNATVQATYTIVARPPPPPSPRPSPRPSPVQVKPTPPQTQPSPASTPSTSPSPDCATGAQVAGCPSPSASACPATAGLPPPGSGGFVDTFIAGAMVAAALSIAGIALFGPGPLLAAALRRRRLLAVLGIAVVIGLTVACDTTIGKTPPDLTPIAAVSPSAAACSASG